MTKAYIAFEVCKPAYELVCDMEEDVSRIKDFARALYNMADALVT